MALPSNTSSIRNRRQRYRPLSEINVTPFVDVMLVLLVVFMISGPLITMGVPLNLPKGEGQTLNEPEQPITLSIQADGTLFLNESPTSSETILVDMAALSGGDFDAKIYLRGDSSLLYGQVMGVMAELSRAGYTRMRLITEQPGEDR